MSLLRVTLGSTCLEAAKRRISGSRIINFPLVTTQVRLAEAAIERALVQPSETLVQAD